jgi:hypothetical protein
MPNRQNKMTEYLHRMTEWLLITAECQIKWMSIYKEWLGVYIV